MPLHPFLTRTKLFKLISMACEPFHKVYMYMRFLGFASKHRDKGRVNDYYNSSSNYNNRFILHDDLLSKLKEVPVFYYEFGVAKGDMIKHWSTVNKVDDSRFVGFDSFDGLPEKWEEKNKGHFDQEGSIPQVEDDRVRFVKGWFQDTVYDELKKCPFHEKCIFHFDADLFSSTLFVLFQVYPKLKKNDIIIFDEFSSHRHEYEAFEIFKTCINKKWEFEFLGAVNNYRQVAFILK